MKLQTMNKSYCFFCVGTGGHVLPAKNLIIELLNSGVSTKSILVVTDSRGVDYFEDLNLEIIKKDFFISKNGVLGYLKNLSSFIRIGVELLRELKEKNVKIIFTTGAYVAPYAALISLLIGSQLFIQEQNKYAGLGNKIASYFPSTVFTSFPETKNIREKNIIFTGPVLNINLIKTESRKSNQYFTIGIQGGSQGSDEINTYLYKFLENNKNIDVNFVHISGPKKDKNNLDNLENYERHEFIKDMNSYYEKIDFQISRGGGGIFEAAYLSIPQLLIPYKYGTTASHQLLNAQYLESLKLAKVVEDYSAFHKILQEVCKFKFNYLDENFDSPIIKVGNVDIFNLITLGEDD
jgi:UDP-N-acetylglucosamine--N-acetylmuramyl-(pentapeptide) pyrophosphoryl-undecaprenol N-acetylglucosamine transferase